jgi:pentatricopeptide repeat protein
LDLFDKVTIYKEGPSSTNNGCLIHGFAKYGELQKALELFKEAQQLGLQLPIHPYTSLIISLGKNNRIAEARGLFQQMCSDGIPPDLKSYNSLLDVCIKNRDFTLALELFDEMSNKNLVPDTQSFNSFIKGYLKAGDLNRALEFLHYKIEVCLSVCLSEAQKTRKIPRMKIRGNFVGLQFFRC